MYLKTLTPERQVSESGLRYYTPTLGRWLSRDRERDSDFYRAMGNATSTHVDPRGDSAASLISSSASVPVAAFVPNSVVEADSNVDAPKADDEADYEIQVKFEGGPANGYVMQKVEVKEATMRRYDWLGWECKWFESNWTYYEWFRLDANGKTSTLANTRAKRANGSIVTTGRVDIHSTDGGFPCKHYSLHRMTYGAANITLPNPSANQNLGFGVLPGVTGTPPPGATPSQWKNEGTGVFTGAGQHFYTLAYKFVSSDPLCECRCDVTDPPKDYVRAIGLTD